MTPPLIGVPCCLSTSEEGSVYHRIGHKYFAAVAEAAGGLPLGIPAIPEAIHPDTLIDRLDGLFVTGSPSNVEPRHYGGPAFRETTQRDPARDGVTLPLIERALARGLPIFAVCRGHQELNVVLGGTLHQHVEELPGKRDHRMRRDIPLNERYDPVHPIDIKPGGMLAEILGRSGTYEVNSLHGQAIDRLADGLFVEAMSDDGIVEAVSLPDAPGYLMSVQWHPEHPRALTDPLNRALFERFGDACRAYMTRK
jgi:putative glutamine amidotransferase